ncbi:MAG TPA: acyl-CoA dehydrogenase family protein [Bacteriovoracaceae bacterium]|nr:acyl-CoA dehydrogenase family protein [Bacteriovoracaceae bacterium]
MDLPLYKHNFDQLKIEADAYRAFFVDTLNSFEVYYRHEKLEDRDEKLFDEASCIIRRRTPLIKYYGAELAVTISQKSIQALGGQGFMDEHSVEQWHRDSFGPLLYEGTSQIQALMAMKDLVKGIAKNPYCYFKSLLSSKIGLSKEEKEVKEWQFQLKKKFGSLIFKSLKPKNISGYAIKANWFSEEKNEKLMIHAETICQGLAYLETMEVLALHTRIDIERKTLFWNYQKLVTPRFLQIFETWKV